jgi:dolichol-phosphate mannosyltransferase
MDKLFVVMPVYNESASIGRVLEEWLPVLKAHCRDFSVLVINDGSTDNTLSLLQAFASRYPEIRVIDRANSGHGQSCIYGYRTAILEGADWVFQIDSDGQCDPRYFGMFWEARSVAPVIYGYRAKREDGLKRFFISRLVSLATFLPTRVWVRDANVPYRLMSSASLQSVLPLVPSDFYLGNILLSVFHEEKYGIRWINVFFRRRIGGVPSMKVYMFRKGGLKLIRQLHSVYSRRAELKAALLGEE